MPGKTQGLVPLAVPLVGGQGWPSEGSGDRNRRMKSTLWIGNMNSFQQILSNAILLNF